MNIRTLGKMALLSRLFPGLMHEMSQPLSQLRMRLDLAEHQGRAPPEFLRQLGSSVDSLCAIHAEAQALLRQQITGGNVPLATVSAVCEFAQGLVSRSQQRYAIELNLALEPACPEDTSGLLGMIVASLLDIGVQAARDTGLTRLDIHGMLCGPEYTLRLPVPGTDHSARELSELQSMLTVCLGGSDETLRIATGSTTADCQLIFAARPA